MDIRDGRSLNIHMVCSDQPGLLLATVQKLDELGLDIQQAVVSCFNGFNLDVFRAEVKESHLPCICPPVWKFCIIFSFCKMSSEIPPLNHVEFSFLHLESCALSSAKLIHKILEHQEWLTALNRLNENFPVSPIQASYLTSENDNKVLQCNVRENLLRYLGER